MNVSDVDAMWEWAKVFVGELSPSKRATIVALSGDLGAGKTTFVKGVARALGITEHITSPTFVIMKLYDVHGHQFKRLVHIDAYRLKGLPHLKVLGWDEILQDPGNLVCIEWPEKIEDAIPEDALMISFEHNGDSRRIIYGNQKK